MLNKWGGGGGGQGDRPGRSGQCPVHEHEGVQVRYIYIRASERVVTAGRQGGGGGGAAWRGSLHKQVGGWAGLEGLESREFAPLRGPGPLPLPDHQYILTLFYRSYAARTLLRHHTPPLTPGVLRPSAPPAGIPPM